MSELAIGTAHRFIDRLESCESWVRRLVSQGEDLRTIKRLRSDLGDELASIIISAARLQSKAVAKLGPPPINRLDEPGVWWVTEKSIQQATPWQVAQHKANWMAATPIVDLCCGIGGDSIQFANRAHVTCIERDPLVAAMASVNLSRGDRLHAANVLCQDVMTYSMNAPSQIHIDPDRRKDARRTSTPELYAPAWADVVRLIGTSPAMIKLAPMAKLDPDELPSSHHRCWISLQRTVREQTLLCGDLVERNDLQPRSRSAIAMSADATTRIFSANPQEDCSTQSASTPESVLVDPDPAIRAAELTEAFAHRHGMLLLGGPSGFLTTGDLDVLSESARQMAIVAPVLWSGPCDMKKIRKELRSFNARAITAKVRGTDHDPAKILRPLQSTGERPLTLWIGRSNDKVYAALT